MSTSEDMFKDRIVTDLHIQREEVNNWYKAFQDGKFIIGISEDELQKLLQDLNNDCVNRSNDMVIEMIINNVMENTNNTRLKKILENIHIANIANDNSVLGKAYGKYYDGSYYVEIGRNISKKMILLSDLFAVLFMYKEDIGIIEKILLDELLDANIQRLKTDQEFNENFNSVQLRMILFEQMSGNNNFTDNYVANTREIYETAMAFFIGHEIGHHFLGHTDPSIPNEQDPKIKEILADFFGVDFSFKFLQRAYFNDKGSYGIHQFAGILIPIIVSKYFCNDIFSDDLTHPSIIKKFYFIQRKLKTKLTETAWKDVEHYINKLFEIVPFSKK